MDQNPEAAGIADFAERTIASGYLLRDQVIDAVTDHAAGALEPAVMGPAECSELVQRLWAQRLDAEQAWPPVTDCDRLDAAFARLATQGILTRQHFRCCTRHGFDAILTASEAVTCTGFVFFSERDTAHAVDGRGLFIAFGAFALSGSSDGAERVTAVGRRAVAALEAEGLDARWDGDANSPIWVGLDWERRLPVQSFEAAG